MDEAETLHITSPYGTDITCSIKGRTARRLWARMPMAALPDYGEVPVIPVEGTTNGVVVTDAGVQGWGYPLKKPIRVEVKKGRALIETVFSEVKEEAERFKNTLMLDENANNCIAEAAIGTSHLVPRVLTGAVRDYAILGYVHIAFGRNLDLGGQTWSTVHQDVLLTEASMKLDNRYILKDGVLQV